MPRNQALLLLHPFFLLNLLLLILNDHWWKHGYANIITGKISDFAGILVMAVFLIACGRFKKLHAVIFTALFFTWWKSPLSESLINTFGSSRVIDYSDLVALIILPVVFYMKPFHYNKLQVKFALPLVAVLAWTAMVATSLPYKVGGYHYPYGHVNIQKHWKTKLTEEDFLQKLDSLHIHYKRDSVEYLPINDRGLMMLVKADQDSIYRMTPVQDLKDTLLYYEKPLDKHYVIPVLIMETDTITNVRFRFYDKGKKKFVELMEMTMPPGMAYKYFLRRENQKKYHEMMKSFMLE